MPTTDTVRLQSDQTVARYSSRTLLHLAEVACATHNWQGFACHLKANIFIAKYMLTEQTGI
jgi:hypothetical protein